MASSIQPPLYAARMPRLAARTVASVAAAAPRKSELRVPRMTCENTSVPWSVVPKK
jgi:hypothetical protein